MSHTGSVFTRENTGDAQEGGGHTAGTATYQRHIPVPYGIMLSNKSCGKNEEEGIFSVMTFNVCLPKPQLRVMEPSFSGDG